MASTSTELPKPQPWPSGNNVLVFRWDWVNWSLVIRHRQTIHGLFASPGQHDTAHL